jgi:hypothetical protein
MTDIDEDQQTHSHTDGKSDDIDKRVSFVAMEVSQGDFQIIFNHDTPPVYLVSHNSWYGLHHPEPVPGLCPPFWLAFDFQLIDLTDVAGKFLQIFSP